jgi:predicted MFS family arabinose efflux permease
MAVLKILKRMTRVVKIAPFEISKSIAVLMVASFINYIGYMVPMFLSIYLHSMGLSMAHISLILTVYGLSGLIGGFWGGFISDKLHPFRVVCVCSLMSSLALILLFFNDNLKTMTVLIFVFGIADFSFRPAFSLLLISNAKQTNSTLLFGINNVIMNVSIGLSAIAGAYLLHDHIQLIFLFDGVFNLITLLLLLIFSSSIRTEITYPIEKDMRSGCVKEKNGYLLQMMTLLGVLFLNVMVFSQLKTTYPIYLQDVFHFNSYDISSVYLLNTIIVIVLEVPLLRLGNQFNQNGVIGLGSLLLCSGFVLCLLTENKFIPFLGVMIWTLGEILFFPTIFTNLLTSPMAKKGKLVGLHQSIFSIGNFVGIPLGFYLYKFNHGTLLWNVCGVVGIATVALLFIDGPQNSVAKSEKAQA